MRTQMLCTLWVCDHCLSSRQKQCLGPLAFLERNKYKAVHLILTFTVFHLGATQWPVQNSSVESLRMKAKILQFRPAARALNTFFISWPVCWVQGKGDLWTKGLLWSFCSESVPLNHPHSVKILGARHRPAGLELLELGPVLPLLICFSYDFF